MPETIPPQGLTLREACQHFAVADTTLRDLLRREEIPTRRERRRTEAGPRSMVVIPPESLRRVAACLLPAAPVPTRDPEQSAPLEDPRPEIAPPVEPPPLPSLRKRPRRNRRRRLRFSDLACSPLALRAVHAGRLACCGVLWLLLSARVAAALAPVPLRPKVA